MTGRRYTDFVNFIFSLRWRWTWSCSGMWRRVHCRRDVMLVKVKRFEKFPEEKHTTIFRNMFIYSDFTLQLRTVYFCLGK